MEPDRSRAIPKNASTVRDCGDFGVDLRPLIRALAEAQKRRRRILTRKKMRGSNGGRDGAIAGLALEHLVRHDLGTSPITEPCPFQRERCKAFGAAQVVLTLEYADGDVARGGPALALQRAILKADKALEVLKEEIGAYGEAMESRGKAATHPITKAEARFFFLPLFLGRSVTAWRSVLAIIETRILRPQIPGHLVGGERRGLLVGLEAMLAGSGWTLDEIIGIIDDKVPGQHSPRSRKDRLRRRLDEYYGKLGTTRPHYRTAKEQSPG